MRVMVQTACAGGWGGCRSTPPSCRARVAAGVQLFCRPHRRPTGRIDPPRFSRTRQSRQNRPGSQHHSGTRPLRTCSTRPAFSKVGVEGGGNTHTRTHAHGHGHGHGGNTHTSHIAHRTHMHMYMCMHTCTCTCAHAHAHVTEVYLLTSLLTRSPLPRGA